jgi:hypothetical protein
MEKSNPSNFAHMAHPSLKGSPNFALFLGHQNPSHASGERHEKRVWMVVISYYWDWRLGKVE